MACVRALTAPSRASCSSRIASIAPVVSFGAAVAVPASTLPTAAIASMRSSLPRRALVARSAVFTSSTVTPSASRWRVRPAP